MALSYKPIYAIGSVIGTVALAGMLYAAAANSGSLNSQSRARIMRDLIEARVQVLGWDRVAADDGLSGESRAQLAADLSSMQSKIGADNSSVNESQPLFYR